MLKNMGSGSIITMKNCNARFKTTQGFVFSDVGGKVIIDCLMGYIEGLGLRNYWRRRQMICLRVRTGLVAGSKERRIAVWVECAIECA